MSKLTGGTNVEALTYNVFNRDINLTLGDGDGLVAWSSKKFKYNTINHKQIRLLISKMEFLNIYWTDDLVDSKIIFVTDNSESKNIDIIEQLYPKIQIFKYYYMKGIDNNFDLSLKGNNIFLISELEDMNLQKELYNKIKPYKALLTFELPTPTPNGPSIYPYLDGLLYIPCFAKSTSMGMCLVPNGELRNWNINKYADLIQFHLLSRQSTQYYNVITSLKNPIAFELGLTNDFDSSLMTFVIIEYMLKHNTSITEDNIKKIIALLIKDLTGDQYFLKKLRDE